MATYLRAKLGQRDKEVEGEGWNSKRIEEEQNNSGRQGCWGQSCKRKVQRGPQVRGSGDSKEGEMLGIKEIRQKTLFEEICSMQRLEESFASVLKNKGAPGVDGVTVEAFKATLGEELSELQKELWSWTYEPQPVRRVDWFGVNVWIKLTEEPCT